MWPTGKMKMLPSKQVTSTVKTNVAAIQWNFNEAGMQDGNCYMAATILCYKETIYVRETTNNVLLNKEGWKLSLIHI